MFCGGLFVACMFCHGELARLKPAPRYLTRFYLMISVGGARRRGRWSASSRRWCCPAYFELAAGIVVCALLLLWQVRRDPPVYGVLGLVAAAVSVGCAIWGATEFYDDTIVGVAQLLRRAAGPGARCTTRSLRRSLVHGTILHGTQYLAPELRPRADDLLHRDVGHRPPAAKSLHPRLDPIRSA